VKKTYAKATRKREGAIHYKHDLGQHFLYDVPLLRHLVEQAGVTDQDRVLEIGSGAGTLTACLCEAAERVIAVEVDEAVLPFLRIATERFNNVEILKGDIRSMDLRAIAEKLGDGFMVVANIPYNITTPILELFLGSKLRIRQMSVMVQKEVAHKMIALPGDTAYGLTSLRCRYFCKAEIVEHVPASAFTPPPKVDSAFVNLVFRDAPLAPCVDEALLWRIIRAGFGQRRKTLQNVLKGVIPHNVEEMRAIFTALGISHTVRGEALSIETWISLANALAASLSKTTE